MRETVDIYSAADVRARRHEVLQRVRVPETELRARGARFALNADELAALDELDGLDYLRDGLTSER